MIAVIFESWPADGKKMQTYLDMGKSLLSDLGGIDLSIGVEC